MTTMLWTHNACATRPLALCLLGKRYFLSWLSWEQAWAVTVAESPQREGAAGWGPRSLHGAEGRVGRRQGV